MPLADLIDEVWGEQPPSSAPHTIESYISRLRRVLEPHGPVLMRHGDGYALELRHGFTDLERAKGLLDEACAASVARDYERSYDLASQACRFWRGPALADVPLAREKKLLDELRLRALEQRFDAGLALDRHDELITELQQLVEQDPYRERFVGQLMLALYRAGRQAEALAVYERTRRVLAEELGLEPSRELQRLSGEIVRHEPQLVAPAALAVDRFSAQLPSLETVTTQRTEATQIAATRWWRRRAAVVVALAGAAAVAASTTAVALVSGGSEAGASRVRANALGLIDANGRRIGGEIPLDAAPTSVARGAGALWVTSSADDSVSRIDPATRSVRQTIPVGSGPNGIAVCAGAVWVANNLDGTVSRIDPATNTEVDKIAVGNGPTAVACGAGSVWVTNSSDRTVSRIDPERDRVVRTIETDAVGRGIAVGAGSIWVTDESSRRVMRIDPETESVETIPVGNGPTGIAFGQRAVWVANALDGTVSRIDPDTDAVATLTVAGGPGAVAVDRGAVWVGVEFGERLVRIDPDPRRPRVVGEVAIGNRPEGMVVSEGGVWVAVQASGRAHRGGRLVALTPPFYWGTSLEPMVASHGNAHFVLALAYDGLTGFRRRGGSEGRQLLPDLAAAIPEPREGGRSYTFRLRPRIRYSDGRFVRPADFRRALERAFEVPGTGVETTDLAAIAGSDSCSPGSRCDLSKSVTTTGSTVTFRLSRPAPHFLPDLADLFPAPPGTPPRDVGTKPFAGTGPYAIESYVPGRQLKLVRNRFFRVWSAAVRPDGYPDEIVLRIEHRPKAMDVARGKADFLIGGVPEAELGEVRLHYRRQLHVEPLPPGTYFLFLDTTQPPFRDARVRRALNYAIDRRRFVDLIGGSAYGRPSCQVIPPNVPGYERYCPYTLDPRRTGEWTAPDVATAQRLIAASGTAGQKVTLWWFYHRAQGRYVASLLRRLGYRVRLKELKTFAAYNRAVFDPKTRAQIGLYGWFGAQDGADALSLLHCGFAGDPARFCDRRIDREARRALTVFATDPAAGRRLWARLDRQVVNQAPWVPLYNPRWPWIVSKRVGNWQWHPYRMVLLDQLWVR